MNTSHSDFINSSFTFFVIKPEHYREVEEPTALENS